MWYERRREQKRRHIGDPLLLPDIVMGRAIEALTHSRLSPLQQFGELTI